MDIEYVDILTGEKLSLIGLANIELVYWSIRSSSWRGGDWVKGKKGVIIILASCDFHFIRDHNNMV